jgi:hypothetical protein
MRSSSASYEFMTLSMSWTRLPLAGIEMDVDSLRGMGDSMLC